MQEAIVDYLQKRQAKWQPDLVVPIGSPAAIFVATYRDRLFPETPIVYASADRRLLPPGALDKNAAYVGQIYEIPGFLEDMSIRSSKARPTGKARWLPAGPHESG